MDNLWLIPDLFSFFFFFPQGTRLEAMPQSLRVVATQELQLLEEREKERKREKREKRKREKRERKRESMFVCRAEDQL